MTQDLLNIKCRIARAQLATALDLFIRDCDPISVHCLACGGAEVIEGVAKLRGEEPFHVEMEEATRKSTSEIRRVRNAFWNAFKHLTEKYGVSLRSDDEALMSAFDDKCNDGVLFTAWYDYMIIERSLPIEAQVFQLWYYALHDILTDSDEHFEVVRELFPGLSQMGRAQQKAALREAVEEFRNDPELLNSHKTERSLL